MKSPLWAFARRKILCFGLACLSIGHIGAQDIISVPKKVFGTGAANAAAYSPDGTSIVTANDAGLFLWDVATGAILRRFPTSVECFYEVAISQDGSTVIAYSNRNMEGTDVLRAWNLASGEELWSVSLTGEQWQIGHPANDTFLLVWNYDMFHVVDVSTGTLLHSRSPGDQLRSATISPDGSTVAVVVYDSNDVTLWDTTSGQNYSVLQGPTQPVVSVAFSPDSEQIITGSLDMTARTWNASTSELIHTLPQQDLVSAQVIESIPVCFSPDGSRALSGIAYEPLDSVKGFLRMWDTATGQELLKLPYPMEPRYLAFSGDGTKFVGAFARWVSWEPQGEITLFDSVTGQDLLTLDYGRDEVDVWLGPDGSSMSVVGDHGHASGWDTSTSQRLFDLHVPVFPPDQSFPFYHGSTFSVSPDGQYLLAPADYQVALWRIRDGQLEGYFEGSMGLVRAAAFSPDGSKILAIASDRTVRMWELATGDELLRLDIPSVLEPSQALAFSPDGSRFAVGSTDLQGRGVCGVYDSATGSQLLVLPTHPHGVVSTAFSPDGSRLITACPNERGDQWQLLRARVWNSESGELLQVFEDAGYGLEHAEFSPDGTMLLIAGEFANGSSTRVIDPVTGDVLASMGTSRTLHATFSPDSTKVLMANVFEGGSLWDVGSGDQLLSLGLSGHCNHVGFTPDGKNVFTGSNGTVAMWELIPTPELAITQESNGSVTLSWDNRSGPPPYVLQQRPNLSVGDWENVTVSTAGQHQIPDPTGTMFYRLMEP